jgi:single-stranded DNA-binding protein
MNSCVLMAEITSEPQLRFTQEGQIPIAEMTVQFPPLRAEEAPGTLKVVGWGNLAEQIQSQFQIGDRVVIEGRLGMNTVERPEGFKEKRAELTASRIHLLGQDTPMDAPANVPAAATSTAAAAAPADPAPVAAPPMEAEPAPANTVAKRPPAAAKAPAAKAKPAATPVVAAEPNYDDIPF